MSARGTYSIGPIAAIILTLEVFAWAIGIMLWIALDRYLPQFRLERPWILWGLLLGILFSALYLIGLALKNRGLKRFRPSR